MSNDQTEATEKRSPGNPRGPKTKPKPPPVRRDPVHRGAHRGDADGQDPLDNFEYRPFEQENALAIDPEIVRGIRDDWGYCLLWVCYEVTGRPFPQLVNARQRNGYAPVTKGNFGGCLDYLTDKHDGGIRHEGLMLMARPVEIEHMAKAHDKRAAKAAIENMRRSHAEEGVSGVTIPGGNDPAALRQNRHRQTFEPLPKIPE
jgi:hypothetical protein